jgi:rhodanese-related sulfurtransferase
MVEEMTAAELHARLRDGDELQVIDVRPEHAFRRGHVPGAENVPITRFARAVADQDWGEEIAVICPHGESSLQAARLLEAYEGVSDDARVANVTDGYAGWEHELERA